MGKSFSLKDFAMPVPESGTEGREQIQYIPLANLIEDEANFYSIEGVEELARNISTVGLQQPLRVRRGEGDDYIIVSGHRRFAALSLLVEEDAERWDEVACIVEAEGESPKLTELRLIFANMDTRKMSSADVARQAERVQELLYELKEEGYEFPGRMRDWVAEAVGVSKSKLSRLKVIRDSLTPELLKAWEAGELIESSAYAYSKMTEEDQRLVRDTLGDKAYEHTISSAANNLQHMRELKCGARYHTNEVCAHIPTKLAKLYSKGYCGYTPCVRKCCKDCEELAKCKSSCVLCSREKDKAQAEAKAAKKEAAETKKKIDQPYIETMTTLWTRFGEARKAAGLSVEEAEDAAMGYTVTYRNKDRELHESGEKISTATPSPYGYLLRVDEVKALCRAADALHTSVDFLLGRDVEAAPAPVPESGTAPAWHSCQDDPPQDLAWVFVVEDHEEFTISRGIARYLHGKYYLEGDEDYAVTLTPEHVWFPCAPTKNMEQWLDEEATDEN